MPFLGSRAIKLWEIVVVCSLHIWKWHVPETLRGIRLFTGFRRLSLGLKMFLIVVLYIHSLVQAQCQHGGHRDKRQVLAVDGFPCEMDNGPWVWMALLPQDQREWRQWVQAKSSVAPSPTPIVIVVITEASLWNRCLLFCCPSPLQRSV